MALDREELKKRQIENGHKHKDNLTMCVSNLNGSELTAHQRNAQKGTVEKRKQKKRIKDITSELLNMSAEDIADNVLNKDIAEKLKGTDITLYDLIVAKQIESALNGSTRSAEYVRDSNGDKPTDKVQTDINVMTETDKQLINMLSDRLDMIEGLQDGTIVDSGSK